LSAIIAASAHSKTMLFFVSLPQSDQETTRFMDVLAGNIPFKEFCNAASIARLLA
jgi:hypothetical protein